MVSMTAICFFHWGHTILYTMNILSVGLTEFLGEKNPHFASSPLLNKGRPVGSEVLSNGVFRHRQVGLLSLPLFRLQRSAGEMGPPPLKILVQC
jgi:hypothetical protein